MFSVFICSIIGLWSATVPLLLDVAISCFEVMNDGIVGSYVST